MSNIVEWDRGADRASSDADVSPILPIIPYGGFSPARLEGWHIRRDLPEASISLSLPGMAASLAARSIATETRCRRLRPLALRQR
jgi:hypothetical protein